MIWAVVGSRDLPSQTRSLVRETLAQHIRLGDAIVSGGARGVDSWAEEWARENGVPVNVIRPDWHRYGKAAGMLRNTQIIQQANAVLACWDGESRGTLDGIRKARRARKMLLVCRC